MRVKGFTLLELLIVLSIASIVLCLTIPLGTDFVTKNRTETQVNQLIQAIHLARHAAIQHAAPVTLCKSADGISCSGTWSAGQILFVDNARSGQVAPDSQLIRVWGPLQQATLQWQGFQSSDYLRVEPMGRTMNGTFLLCPVNGDMQHARRIIVNRTGRVWVSAEGVDGSICR